MTEFGCHLPLFYVFLFPPQIELELLNWTVSSETHVTIIFTLL